LNLTDRRVLELNNGIHKRHQGIHNTKDAVVLTQARPPYAITHVNAPWCEMCG